MPETVSESDGALIQKGGYYSDINPIHYTLTNRNGLLVRKDPATGCGP
jgi:hypothetical protein